jgi:hypothetical protein
MGILLAGAGWQEWRVHRAIQGGPAANALVTGKGSCPGWQSCTLGEHILAVTFRLSDGSPQRASVTVSRNDSHPVGSRLRVRYDGRNPSRAEYVHHGSPALGAFVLGIFFVVGSIVGGAFFRRVPLVA